MKVMVERMATPRAPPTCWLVLISPDAMPARSCVTPTSEAIWTGTNENPSPSPAMTNPGARSTA